MVLSSTLLCDVGGTHARFARLVKKGEYDNFKKYRLLDFTAFTDMIETYQDETGLNFSEARFATALVPVNDVIAYKRYDNDPVLKIDFKVLATRFGWKKWHHRMDSQAGGMGLRFLSSDMTHNILPATSSPSLNDGKILIAVGTGIYHALIRGENVSTCTDGHYLPVTVTREQREIEHSIRQGKNPNLSLIMEDFVSARGLRSIAAFVTGNNYVDIAPDAFMQDIKNHPKVIRLFFEFLGIYTHMAVTISGHYGGVYLTGGVIDHLIKNGLTDWTAFETYFRPPMLSVVNTRLGGVNVHYVLHDELPLLGLTTL